MVHSAVFDTQEQRTNFIRKNKHRMQEYYLFDYSNRKYEVTYTLIKKVKVKVPMKIVYN
jgi:hypothetical protein